MGDESAMTYTLDYARTDSGWTWRMYERGGSVLVTSGNAASIESALDDAKRALLVHHRDTA